MKPFLHRHLWKGMLGLLNILVSLYCTHTDASVLRRVVREDAPRVLALTAFESKSQDSIDRLKKRTLLLQDQRAIHEDALLALLFPKKESALDIVGRELQTFCRTGTKCLTHLRSSSGSLLQFQSTLNQSDWKKLSQILSRLGTIDLRDILDAESFEYINLIHEKDPESSLPLFTILSTPLSQITEVSESALLATKNGIVGAEGDTLMIALSSHLQQYLQNVQGSRQELPIASLTSLALQPQKNGSLVVTYTLSFLSGSTMKY